MGRPWAGWGLVVIQLNLFETLVVLSKAASVVRSLVPPRFEQSQEDVRGGWCAGERRPSPGSRTRGSRRPSGSPVPWNEEAGRREGGGGGLYLTGFYVFWDLEHHLALHTFRTLTLQVTCVPGGSGGYLVSGVGGQGKAGALVKLVSVDFSSHRMPFSTPPTTLIRCVALREHERSVLS